MPCSVPRPDIIIMCVKFVVDSALAPRSSSTGTPEAWKLQFCSLQAENNISKFQFDPEYNRHTVASCKTDRFYPH